MTIKIIQILSHSGMIIGLADNGKLYRRADKEPGYFWVPLPTEFETKK
jgi:hypothetical protein